MPAADGHTVGSTIADTSLQAIGVVLMPDEATGLVSVSLSCEPLSRQHSITDGQSLIAALEQEELDAKGGMSARRPPMALAVGSSECSRQSR